MPAWITKELIIDVVIALLLFGGGYELRVKLDAAAKTAQLEEQAKATAAAQADMDRKAAAWEIKRAALEKANNELQGRLKHETKKRIYATCIVPPDGVSIYNDALSGTAGSKPVGVLP